MIGFVQDWLGAKRAEFQARQRNAAAEARLLESYTDIANRYIDVDQIIYGQDLFDEEGAQSQRRVNLSKARNDSRTFVERNAHAKNVCNQIVNFTVGTGFAIKFEEEGDRDRWRESALTIRWPKRRREIMRRIARDGEAPLRRFGGEQVRFVEPEDIRNPPGVPDSEEEGLVAGVKFDPEDVETIEGYFVAGEPELVPADEMFIFRDPFVDIVEPRGWPIMFDAIPIIQQYERWVRTRATLNQLRAAIFAIRKHKDHTPAQLTNFADRVKGGTLTRPSGQAEKWRDKPLPGTMLELTGDLEYEFPGANIQAGDVADDGRAMRLLIAVYFSFPEYWVTGDASNSNFSSTLVAENPGIIAMRSWQGSFGDDLRSFISWLWGRPVELDLTYPNLVTRDVLKDAQANNIKHDAGVLSRETWQEREGLDPETERKRMAIDSEEL